MKEKNLERMLVRTVKQSGGIALKFVSPGMAGVPDRLVLFPGRANLLRPPVAEISQKVRSAETSDLHGCAVAPIEAAGRVAFVEMKAPGKKPTALQRLRHAQLRSLGFRVFVIDGKEQIEEMLNEIRTP